MCLWVTEHLGQHRELQIDRIDNNGHYEPGNLRWSNSSQNASHTRKRMRNALVHKFRQEHPEIRYADSTLPHLVVKYTFEEIVERYHRKSHKPKGVYGTFSTADPFIASLSKGS